MFAKIFTRLPNSVSQNLTAAYFKGNCFLVVSKTIPEHFLIIGLTKFFIFSSLKQQNRKKIKFEVMFNVKSNFSKFLIINLNPF